MKSFAVERRGGAYPLDEVLDRFRRNGFVILKGFLPRDTRDDVRGIFERERIAGDQRGAVMRLPIHPKAEYLLGDLLAIEALRKYDYIFFRQELLDLVRKMLGSEELLYFGDSSVQFGEAARGFHKDNVERYDGTRDDWQGDYGLVRCGFYCQDHERYSGGLKIRVASHNIPDYRRGKILDVSTSYGDVVIWSMRLTHSGNNRKLKWMPGLGLHPRVEEMCPPALVLPEQLRRISAFCAFGRPGSHADRYINNLDVRAKDYKAYLQRALKPEVARPLLARYGITLRQPNEAYYGELN